MTVVWLRQSKQSLCIALDHLAIEAVLLKNLRGYWFLKLCVPVCVFHRVGFGFSITNLNLIL